MSTHNPGAKFEEKMTHHSETLKIEPGLGAKVALHTGLSNDQNRLGTDAKHPFLIVSWFVGGNISHLQRIA